MTRLLLALLVGCAAPQVRQNAAPSDARTQYQQARLAWELGDLQGAFDGWTRLLRGRPLGPESSDIGNQTPSTCS